MYNGVYSERERELSDSKSVNRQGEITWQLTILPYVITTDLERVLKYS